jgi:hypothetical protein
MTQIPNQPTDKARSIELLESLLEASETQTAIISDLANAINSLVATLTAAAQLISHPPAVGADPRVSPSQPAPAPAGAFQDFEASAIIMTYNDKGEPAFKIVGFPFNTFGVRCWPETLPTLGIDPAQLKPGPNPYAAQVRAMMVESSATGKLTPKKIIGLTPKG